MKKLLFALALVILLGSGVLALSAPAATQASTIHRYTLADDGRTVTVDLGDYLLLDFGSGYNWTMSVANPFGRPPVLQMLWWQNGDRSWGGFDTIGKGEATISGYGFPKCPGCQIPPLQFKLTVVVQ